MLREEFLRAIENHDMDTVDQLIHQHGDRIGEIIKDEIKQSPPQETPILNSKWD